MIAITETRTTPDGPFRRRHTFRGSVVHFGQRPPPGKDSVVVGDASIADHHAKLFYARRRFWLLNLCGLPCVVLKGSGRTIFLTVTEPVVEIEIGDLRATVLDLGLNVAWDNKHMIRVLRHLALNEAVPDSDRPTTCEAHGLALLAHQHKVPCALLTNYADYLGGDPPLTLEKLAEAFRAKEIFHKDSDGITACARWLRQHAGMVS